MKPMTAVFLNSAVIAALSLLPVPPSLCQAPMGQGPMGRLSPLDPSIKRTFVPLAVPMALYEPVAPGEKSHIGVFVQHSGGNYTTHSACTELSKRGYTVLCAAAPSAEILDGKLLQARSGIAYLREYPAIQKVILFGHSGGATLMTAYQLVAENGPKACQGPEKIVKCADSLAGLPPADGVILADSNWGNAAMALFSLDPAVLSNESGMTVSPDLDLWNPRNGFNPAGSNYSQEFVRRFQSAVAKRENELIKTALDRLAAIEAGKGRFADDEPFVVSGAGSLGPNNKLFAQDTRLMSHTKEAWPLLHADGSITTETVRTVRLPQGAKSLTPSLNPGALNKTVRSFLTDSAIRVTDDFGYDESSVRGVEWTSSYSSPPGNVESITVPLLLMGMTGGYEYLAHETIYEHARSSDKTLVFVEGATHNFSPCKQCEKTPGQFGDTVKTLYDYVDKWLSQKGRFW
jgi:pimeloyl-ACP methyl ester carboxylesterase